MWFIPFFLDTLKGHRRRRKRLFENSAQNLIAFNYATAIHHPPSPIKKLETTTRGIKKITRQKKTKRKTKNRELESES